MERILNGGWRLYALLAAWSAAALMLLSPDSPLHGPWNHLDSAWFYMSGKAMMSGLRPYVDFTDSKGPLLWLIYGVGYLLSPRSYTGLYVVSSLWYAGIFYYNFKTARLFLGDGQRSLAVTALMTVAYFMYWFHYEVRAEDFATLPVAVSLYCLCRVLHGSGNATAHGTAGGGGEPSARLAGAVLGGCFMALVMIKYSIAAMQGLIVAVLVFHYVWDRSDYSILRWLLAGMAATGLPFVCYFMLTGALPAFIQEYFVNTLLTVFDKQSYGKSFSEELESALCAPENLALLFMIVYGGWLIGRQLPRFRHVPMLLGVAFMALSTRHNLGYYYSCCNIFTIYLLTATAQTVMRPGRWAGVAATAIGVLAWGVVENVREGSALNEAAIWRHHEEREVYEEISGILASRPGSRMMYIFAGEWGHGLAGGCLPAGLYWAYQFGSTSEMEAAHTALLESGKADFVIAYESEKSSAKGWTPERICAQGYEICYSRRHLLYMFGEATTVVFKKIRCDGEN